MRRSLLILLLLVQAFGCSGREFEASGPGTPPGPVTPGEPAEPDVKYVASAAQLGALGTLPAGSVVVWRNGTYADVVVDVRGVGTAEKRVVLRAETPGGVCFTGTSRVSISGSYVEVSGMRWRDPDPVKGKSVITLAKGSNCCVVSACAITGDNTEPDAVTDTKWVSLYGTNNKVEGSTFRDKRNIGTLLVVWLEAGITPRHTIANNRFERPVTLWGADGKAVNGQETIRIGTSDYSMQNAACTVEGSYFYHCHGEQAEIISNKSCRNVYAGNLFVECQGALTMRHGNNCIIRGNYFLGNGMENTGGIRLIGEGHTAENNYLRGLRGSGYRTAICLVRGQKQAALSGYWQVKNAVVRKNTIVNCKYAFNVNYGSGDQVLPVITSVIEDNIVSLDSSSDYLTKCATSPAPDITWKNNTLYGGRQDGTSLTEVKTPPVLPDVEAVTDAISAKAGCRWQEN